MGAASFNRHPRAMDLSGKRVLDEFAAYEARAEALIDYCKKLQSVFVSRGHYPWPDRPTRTKRSRTF